MHCKATKVLGSRMQHGNANEMLGLSDAMKTTRSPQRRARRKGNKMLGRSDATKTTRSPQQRAHCRATKVSVHGLQSRQCAAHSGARTARETKSLGITHTPQQIGRLPLKMNVMIDRAHIWKVIYNARRNKSHPPTSPNTAPATQNESHD